MYLSYKSLRLNGVKLDEELPPVLFDHFESKFKEYDLKILQTVEDFYNEECVKELNHHNWAIASHIDANMYMTLMNIEQIPDFLHEYMIVFSHYVRREPTGRVIVREMYSRDMCIDCFNNHQDIRDFNAYTYWMYKYGNKLNAEDIIGFMQYERNWCCICKTTPLFILKRVHDEYDGIDCDGNSYFNYTKMLVTFDIDV